MQQGIMELLWRSSHISGGNAVYVEALYEAYLRDPNAIPAEWRDYFDRLPQVNGTHVDIPHSTVQEGEHPSYQPRFPSSHFSLPARTPSPHLVLHESPYVPHPYTPAE